MTAHVHPSIRCLMLVLGLLACDASQQGSGPLGSPCETGADCESGYCVAVSSSRAVCTDGCEDDVSCPGAPSWRCVTTAEGPRVCGCESSSETEVCGDGADNDCDGRTDDCVACGERTCGPNEICEADRCVPRPSDGGVPMDGGSSGCDCDDEVACTVDECADGDCVHRPDHLACPSGERCDPTDGCSEGPVCGSDADCVSDDPCVLTSCDGARRVCVYRPLDGDGDGHPPLVCGGGDCDDSRADVHPGALDVCDGVDADCGGDVDPPDAPGCEGFESCDGTGCGCEEPYRFCGGCIDPRTDPLHCGGCDVRCWRSGEVCEDGACRCPTGHTLCGSVCRDTQSDPDHCGGCDLRCDEALCVSGACECPSGTTRCDVDGAIQCADLDVDPRHCSACGAACFSGSLCSAGACELSGGTDARGYAWTPTTTSPSGRRYADMDESTGWTYAALLEEELPVRDVATDAMAYQGGDNLVAFDPTGDVRWVANGSLALRGVAAGGGRVHASGWGESPVTFGGQTFTATSSMAEDILVLLELDATTGAVLASRVLDYASSVYTYEVDASPSGELLLVGTFQAASTDPGGGAIDIADGPLVVARYGPGLAHLSSWRLPGRGLTSGAFDAVGDIVVWGSTPSEPASFGGAVIGSRYRAERFVARYTPTGAHRNSFVVNNSANVIVAAADGVFMGDRYDPPWIYFHPYQGEGAGTRVDPPYGWVTIDGTSMDTVEAYERDGSLYVAIDTYGMTTMAGRTFDHGRQTVLARMDRTALAIEAMGVIHSPNTSFTHRTPGLVRAMMPTGTDTVRVFGDLVGTLRFGAFDLVAAPDEYGSYFASFQFAP